MSKLSFRLEYSEPPCQADSVYYALMGKDSFCLGRELEYVNDTAEPDFMTIAERAIHEGGWSTDRASHFVVSKLCFLDHPTYEDGIPGPQLELIANVVVSARGARPFVPILTGKDFPSIFNAEGVGDPTVDPMYRLQTLPAIGDDMVALRGSKHHFNRYTPENPPQRAIETKVPTGRAYHVLDEAVAALILKDEHNQLSLAAKTW